MATCAPVVAVATAGRPLRAWSGTRPALAPTVPDPLPWLECPLKPRLRSRSFCVCGWPRAGPCCHVTARLEGEGRLGRGGRQPEREASRRSTADPFASNGLSAFWGGCRAGSAGEPTSLGSCSSRWWVKRPLRPFDHLLPARRRVAEGHESVGASGAVSRGDTDRASTRRRRNERCETRSGSCSHERSPHRPTTPCEALRRRDHARLRALGKPRSGVIDDSVRHADRLCLRSERLRLPMHLRGATTAGALRARARAYAWEEWSASATRALLPLPRCDSGGHLSLAVPGAAGNRPSRQ